MEKTDNPDLVNDDLRRELEEARAEIERLQRLLSHATQENPGTSTLVMLMNEASEAKAERDALKQKLDELPAMYREDIESLNGCVERLGSENTKLRSEVERLRHERRMFRRRLVECLPWVGCTPYPNTSHFNEMIACRDLAKDTLDEVPE